MVEIVNEPPSILLTRMMDGCLVAQLIHVAAELGLADLVSERPRPVEELADLTETHPDALYRALRALAAAGVFTESTPRAFGLTPLADVLRTDAEDSVRDLARIRGSREHWQAWTDLGYTVRTGRSAFRHVYGTDWWSYISSHAEQGALFNKAMGNNSQQVHAAAVESYDLSDVKRLVDVGGGHGYLVAALLQRYPEMNAVVFDQPHVVASAEDVLTKAGVRDRAELAVGDFFESVPSGGDAYVLCRILHDWDDQRAGTILSTVRRVISPTGKVIVIDSVVPEGDVPHPAKVMDIIMLTLHEGKERTEAEFAKLFEAAGLCHAGTWHTPSPISVIVANAD